MLAIAIASIFRDGEAGVEEKRSDASRLRFEVEEATRSGMPSWENRKHGEGMWQ